VGKCQVITKELKRSAKDKITNAKMTFIAKLRKYGHAQKIKRKVMKVKTVVFDL
jgi:hypothetical protein